MGGRKKKFQWNFLHRHRSDQLPLLGIISFFSATAKSPEVILEKYKAQILYFPRLTVELLFFNEKVSLM